MKEIKLTQGKIAIVDDEDFEELSKYKWHFRQSHNTYYAKRSVKNTTILMHRVILNARDNFQVDHINGDGLDNRRSNLRECTASQNAMNRRVNSVNQCGHKGIRFECNKYMARIMVNGKNIYLGRFYDINDAIKAYSDASLKYHGVFRHT